MFANSTPTKHDLQVMESLRTMLDKKEFILEKDFPHVFRMIVLFWGSPDFHDYINSLVVNKRKEARQGFPIDAMKEISEFNKLHDEMYPEHATKQEPMFTCS